MGRKAGLNLPKAINPKSLMEHFLKQGLQWRGQKVEFDVITTNKVGDLSAHLKSLQRAPQSLTWRVFQAAAFKGKVWTMGAMLFLQKSVVRPIAGLVFYPIPKDSPPPEPTEQN